MRYGAYSHAAVERILAVQARPKTVLESLAEEERRLPPWLGEDPVIAPADVGLPTPRRSGADADEDPTNHRRTKPPPGTELRREDP